ncbi:MAG TPA: hypothetical protein VFA49_07545 [Chloroflexota bacterium]|nr:hypothetical protein [Chloroflexota bacterium]
MSCGRRARRLAVWAAWLGVLVAAVLRLAWLDLVQFGTDEASWLKLAEDLVRFGRVPETGLMSSQGIPAPPHFVYLLAPLVALGRDPAVATGAIALANVGAVAATAWLAWRWFGPLPGATATLLYAVNPWAVFWSRKIWQPDLLAPIALLLVFGLDRALVGRRLAWAALAFPLVALGTMTHYSFVVLAPLLLVAAGLLLRARAWGLLALAAAVTLLVLLPFLAHEQRIAWLDYPSLRYYMALREPTVDLEGLGYALSLATGWGTTRIGGVPVEHFAPDGLLTGVTLIETALLAVALALALGRVVGPLAANVADRARLAGLLAWSILPIGATLRHSWGLHDHYFLVLYPAPFLLIGAAVQWTFAHWPSRVIVGGVALTVAGQLVLAVGLAGDLQRSFEPCYDLSLGAGEAVARDLIAFGARTGSTRGAVELDEADASAIAYLLRPAFFPLVMTNYGDISLASVVRADSGPPSPSADMRYANGVRVLGVWTPDRPILDWRPRLAIAWQAAGAASAGSISWQLRLADSQVVPPKRGYRHDLGSLGEQVTLSWFTFEVPRELPAGTYPLAVDLLDGATGQAVPLVDANGVSHLDWSQPLETGFTPRCRAD